MRQWDTGFVTHHPGPGQYGLKDGCAANIVSEEVKGLGDFKGKYLTNSSGVVTKKFQTMAVDQSRR